ncbi:unnamed protein product [Clavelina lepadiformis]|uniref:Galaxin-like repeats domain-containing protein n=1 Tax=Clavelina lepadiformis TaxID=159417 RepID=A0ABP0FL30_CLALP
MTYNYISLKVLLKLGPPVLSHCPNATATEDSVRTETEQYLYVNRKDCNAVGIKNVALTRLSLLQEATTSAVQVSRAQTGTNYNMHTHICLNGQILKKSRDSESACAFTQRYDTNTEECCLKNEKYGQVHFKNPRGICCNEKYLTDPQLNCCQGVIYNTTKQACCKSGDGDYTLHNNSNACCLNVPYNSAVQYCGDHGVQEKDQTEIRQCNGTPYDSTWHMCCGDTLADTRTHLCHWSTGRLVLKPSYGIHHDKVCRTRHTLVSYYSGISDRSGERQVCIDGVGLVMLALDEDICYEAPNYKYNTINIHLCCGKEKFYEHGRRDGKQCCKNGVYAYYPSIETCCPNDQIVAVPEQYGRCCGMAGYDSRTHSCKDGEIVEDECAAMGKPLQPEDCTISEQQLLDFNQKFHRSGLYVYFATVHGRPTETGRGKRQVRRWKLEDVEQLKNKGKKMTLVPPKGKKFSVTAKKCQCPYELVAGERYIFWSEKKFKGRKGLILNAMQTGYRKSFDAIMPLSKTDYLSQFFERLFGTE